MPTFGKDKCINDKMDYFNTHLAELTKRVIELEHKVDNAMRCKGCTDAGVAYALMSRVQDMSKEIEQLKRGEKHECKCGACTEVQDDT